MPGARGLGTVVTAPLKRLAARLVATPRGTRVIAIAACIPLTVLTAGVMFQIAGISPTAAYAQIVRSSFGNWYATSNSLMDAVPMFLVAVGVAVALRAGLWNIGGDGQIYVGAIAGTFLGLDGPHVGLVWDLVIGIFGSAAAGALFALIPALLKAWANASEVVTTLMMVYVGSYLVSYLLTGTGPLAVPGSTFPASNVVHSDWRFPVWGGSALDAGIVVVPVVAFLAYVLMRRSTFGLQSRALGENLQASVACGVPVKRVIVWSMCISGACAGLAGGVEVLGVYGRLVEGFDPSYGFTGIAVALLGGLTIPGMAVAALLFGGLQAGGVGIQVLGGSGAIVEVTEGAATLYLVALLGGLELRRRRRQVANAQLQERMRAASGISPTRQEPQRRVPVQLADHALGGGSPT